MPKLKSKPAKVGEQLFEAILSRGIFTGSKVFGGWKETSDIDLLLPNAFFYKEEVITFNEMIDMGAVYLKDYGKHEFRSCYILSPKDDLFNLMFFEDEKTRKNWMLASSILLSFKKVKPFRFFMKKKQNRVFLFELVLQGLK